MKNLSQTENISRVLTIEFLEKSFFHNSLEIKQTIK